MKPVFIVDGHSDYALKVFSEHKKGKKQILMNQYLPLLLDGNIKIVTIQVGGDFVLYKVDWHDPINVYLTIGAISQEVSENSEKFTIITAFKDFDNLFKGNKIGFLLSLEGASSINKGFSHLRNYYRLGLRALSITHNEKNVFADGLLVENSGGLSELGVELISEVNKLNILLDLVHISEKGFFEALNIYKKAPIISHSNAKGIYDIYRNLTDEQILAVSNRDGVIGINFIAEFIGPQKDKVTAENLVDHIDYIVNLAGIKHVGLGPDFTYYIPGYDHYKFAGGIKDYSGIYLILNELERRGYSDLEIRKIMGRNFVRVYKKTIL